MIVDGKCSNWLNVLPLAKFNFDLSPVEFRDALALRYRKKLLGIPSNCDGCGEATSLEHALSCRHGGLVIQQHNQIRDSLGDIAALAFREVIKEPVVHDADPENDETALKADLGIRGLW